MTVSCKCRELPFVDPLSYDECYEVTILKMCPICDYRSSEERKVMTL